MLLLASCQMRQTVQTYISGSSAQLIHKGKATTSCTTADRMTQATAQQQAQSLPGPLFFTTLPAPVAAGSKAPSFFSRLPLRHNAPPFYVLYKSWKIHLA